MVRAQAWHGGDTTVRIDESAPINNLIKRAHQGIDRQDWKLAIDSIQRIIDDPKGVLLERPDGRYESGRRFAVGLLSGLPAEGLAAYRILTDGRARGTFDRAVADHDVPALQDVTDRYLMTNWGDDAAAVLASWLLDDGRAAEALGILNELAEFRPDTDVPVAELAALRATAHGLLGERAPAARYVQETIGAWDDQRQASLAALVETLSDEVRGRRVDPRGPGRDSWPVLGGGGDRSGLMPAVQPTLMAKLPWRQPLPQAQAVDWSEYLARRESAALPPAFHAVVSDGRLFVKGAGRCAAIDLESFERLWEAEPEVEGLAERYGRRFWQTARAPLEGQVTLSRSDVARYDYAGSSLSVVGDVLVSLRRRGSGQEFDDQEVFIRGRGGGRVRLRIGGRSGRSGAQASGCRLVAYDVASGALGWQRGLGLACGDELARAEFLSAPIGRGDELWAPTLIDGALSLLVMDRVSGRLDRRITLCVPPPDSVWPTEALYPVLSGGIVYVPTGQGLLFAVRADDYRPVWAATYARSPAAGRRGTSVAAWSWLSGPPVVAGRLVLVGPTDSDRLFAFDRWTGALRWEVPRATYRYVIAADGDAVWLGGKEIGCLSAETGQTRWTSGPVEATGRAIRSGALVYVPTVTGLTALDARDGQVRSQVEMPTGHPALGNLLVAGDSLISVDATEVRKYPDLDQAYARAVASWEADRGDVGLATRLAWMELFRDAPQRAWAVLEGLDADPSAVSPRRMDQVTHLRVEALLAMAARDDIGVEAAIEHLERAVATATAGEDALRAGLALGRRLQAAGRYESAYRFLWRLGRSEASDGMVDTSDGVRCRARVVIGATLARLADRVPAEMLTAIDAQADDEVAAAIADLMDPVVDRFSPTPRAAVRTLRSLADLGARSPWGQAALLALADWGVTQGRYEPAEQNYRAAIRSNANGTRSARALLGLAELYLRDDQNQVLAATECLDRLEREHAPHDLPVTPGVERKRVAQEIDRLRRLIDADAAARHRRAMAPGAFRLTDQWAWPEPLERGHPRLINIRGGRPEALTDRILTVADGEVVQCHRLDDGTVEWWEAELRMPQRFRLDDIVSLSSGASGRGSREVSADGQTMVITGPGGLYGVGVVTGKRLWAVPVDAEARSGEDPMGDRLVWASGRRVACIPERGLLAVLDSRDGSRVWERPVGLEQVGAVRIHDGCVIVADPAQETAVTYRLDNGRYVATLRFDQGGADGSPLDLAPADGMLCGPDGAAAIAYDLADGRQRWRVEIGETLNGLFTVSADLLGVGGADGALKLIERADGEVLYDGRVPGRGRGAVDGALDAGVLVVVATADRSGSEPLLLGIDLVARSIRWQRDDLADGGGWLLRAAQGVVPAFVHVREPGRGVSSGGAVALSVIDTQTGLDVGPAVIPQTRPGYGWRNADLAVWPGRLLLANETGIAALQTEPVKGD
ncbi:MAG: PQQ-binding-like beta-propeller repeat protein [bacterium]|nr:PQQ-binding-like beta-propeller repeat protein [bacterium]